ncbi:MAG: hypothetical protein H0Z40_01400 [Desulfotomaculum sp.]|nr:hypothetical protein [Desulfotomaculum sp.]
MEQSLLQYLNNDNLRNFFISIITLFTSVAAAFATWQAAKATKQANKFSIDMFFYEKLIRVGEQCKIISVLRYELEDYIKWFKFCSEDYHVAIQVPKKINTKIDFV